MDEYLIGLIAALAGIAIWQTSKRRTAEARNENIETQKKLVELDKQKLDPTSEEALQAELREKLTGKAKDHANLSEILDLYDRILADHAAKRRGSDGPEEK